MRRFERDEVNKIIDDFLEGPYRMLGREYHDITPSHLRKQLVRRIRERALNDLISVTIMGDTTFLLHNKRKSTFMKNGQLIISPIPILKR